MSDKTDPVAAVCENEVRIFGAMDEKTLRRPLRDVIQFPHRGAAVVYAQEFDDARKPKPPARTA